jgi:pimeloyl-ACP methyl ester carboxylesterase
MLDVREWGPPEGSPVVLVHGWSQSQLCWSRQLTGGLADDFRLVTFDNRGHGMSEKPDDAAQYVDPRLWADDLAAIIDALELVRPVLVAWSYGGLIVTDYVRTYGDGAIGGINLVGGAVMLKPPEFDHIGPGFLGNAPDACRPELSANINGILRFLRACTARPLDPDDWSTALAWNMVVPPAVRGALIARSIDATDVLAGLAVPVLISHGRRDEIILPSMAEHALRVCPTAEASWYEDAGHMPFVEDAARFDRELARFAA